jgi:hypothetical protein
MTKLLDKAVAAAKRLQPEDQDELARVVLAFLGDESESEDIDPGHLADIHEALAQAKRREFATNTEIEAAFRRFDP